LSGRARPGEIWTGGKYACSSVWKIEAIERSSTEKGASILGVKKEGKTISEICEKFL